jgi:hypothetical protein
VRSDRRGGGCSEETVPWLHLTQPEQRLVRASIALSEAFGLAGPPPRGLHIVAGRQCRCAFRRPPDPKFFSMQSKHRDDRPSRRRRLRGNCSLGFISTHSEHRLVRLMGFRLRPRLGPQGGALNIERPRGLETGGLGSGGIRSMASPISAGGAMAWEKPPTYRSTDHRQARSRTAVVCEGRERVALISLSFQLP